MSMRNMENPFRSKSTSGREEDEEALRWAAIEKLPTYNRLRTSILQSVVEPGVNNTQLINVLELKANDKQMFVQRNFQATEEDNEKFLKKLRERIDRFVNCNLIISFLLFLLVLVFV